MPDSHDEERLLERIDDALRDAVEAKNLNWSRATRIKRQKYTNMALDHFTTCDEPDSAPVTRSWFKYGETQPLSPAGPNRLEFDQPEKPGRHGELGISDDIDFPASQSIYDVGQTRFMQFFLREAESPPLDEYHWNLQDLDFLDIYYQEHAPSDLCEVYLANIELRQILVEAKDTLKEIYENRAALFRDSAETVPNFSTNNYYKKSGQAAIRLRLAMRRHDELFDESIEPIQQCSDLIENVLMQLERIPPEDVIRPHTRIVQELEDFYDSAAWLLAAYEMSAHTAEGPHSQELQVIAHENFESELARYESALDEIRGDCAEYALLPKPSDFPSQDDESAEYVNSMLDIIDTPDDHE